MLPVVSRRPLIQEIPVRRSLAALIISTVALIAPVPLAGSAHASPQPQNEWRTYYYNYFYSKSTCEARGRAITDPNSSQYIPGFTNYFCYYTGPKWSMDVYDAY